MCHTFDYKNWKVTGHRGQWPFVTWWPFVIHGSMRNFIRNKFCHYVLDAKSYDSKSYRASKTIRLKKARKNHVFCSFLFVIKKTKVDTIPIIIIPYVKFPALQNGSLRIWKNRSSCPQIWGQKYQGRQKWPWPLTHDFVSNRKVEEGV